MKENKTIDELCPAGKTTFGLKKDKDYVCKITHQTCYVPTNYKGCPEYKLFERAKAVAEDYKIRRVI